MMKKIQTYINLDLMIEIRKKIAPFPGLGVVNVINELILDSINKNELDNIVKKANEKKNVK